MYRGGNLWLVYVYIPISTTRRGKMRVSNEAVSST